MTYKYKNQEIEKLMRKKKNAEHKRKKHRYIEKVE